MKHMTPKEAAEIVLHFARDVAGKFADKRLNLAFERLNNAIYSGELDYNKDIHFGKVVWMVDDVIGMAKEMKIQISPEEAKELLEGYQGKIADQMISQGWDSIRYMLEQR